MTDKPELLRCPFQRGQCWINPEDEMIMVTNVRPQYEGYKVSYISETGEIGSFHSTTTFITENIEQISEVLNDK